MCSSHGAGWLLFIFCTRLWKMITSVARSRILGANISKTVGEL